jgi:phage baseplate assembly protein V
MGNVTQRVMRYLRLMITRGVLQQTLSDQPGQQVTIECLSGDSVTADQVQQYGLTSHAPPGADCTVLQVGSDRSHTILIGTEHRQYRLTGLAQGEVALYDDQGQHIVLKRDGLHVHSPQQVLVQCPNLICQADQILLEGEVALGSNGGKPVARIGDHVEITSGSSRGRWPIVSGASQVTAA